MESSSQFGQTYERVDPEISVEAIHSLRKKVAADKRSIRLAPYYGYKYAVDRTLGLILLIPALPIIGILYLLVRMTSRGPGFYLQERVGRNGRPFMLIKLRTMRVDAEKDSGPVWAAQNDPRTTWLGRILRQTHLDEFPQLINVVRGDMAIVGPRPERPHFVEKFSNMLPRYRQRHMVRPGITGMAAIYLPPDETDECVRNKLAFDLEYICTATLLTDIQIWFCTALRLSGMRRGLGPKLSGLNRRVARYRQRAIRQTEPLHVSLTRQEAQRRRDRQLVRTYGAMNPMSESSLDLFLEHAQVQPAPTRRKPR